RSTQMLLEQGQALVAARAYRDAAAVFQLAATQRPDDVFAWASLGRTQEILGQVDAARQSLERAAELDPDSALAQRFLGMFYERRGEDAPALAAYEAAVAADGDDAAARLLLAHARMRSQDLAAAAQAYRAVASQRPGNVLARYYLALAELAQGRCDPAAAALVEGLRIKGNYGPLLEAQARHAGVCAQGDGLDAALEVAGQLNAARPDAASAVTLAIVQAALGDGAAAREARSLALARAADPTARARIDTQLPADGSPASRAWLPDSPALAPPRLRPDRLN
ncbi:MAG: tetratricopeptide repeat protein, partial [Pseudomonadota bacterium]